MTTEIIPGMTFEPAKEAPNKDTTKDPYLLLEMKLPGNEKSETWNIGKWDAREYLRAMPDIEEAYADWVVNGAKTVFHHKMVLGTFKKKVFVSLAKLAALRHYKEDIEAYVTKYFPILPRYIVSTSHIIMENHGIEVRESLLIPCYQIREGIDVEYYPEDATKNADPNTEWLAAWSLSTYAAKQLFSKSVVGDDFLNVVKKNLASAEPAVIEREYVDYANKPQTFKIYPEQQRAFLKYSGEIAMFKGE